MSALRTLAAAMLLSGGVAAAVAAVTVRLAGDEAPRIASVRLAELTAQYAARTARGGASEHEMAEAIRAWARDLEAVLDQAAARHGVVLLPARAVAAGAPDPDPRNRGGAGARRAASHNRTGGQAMNIDPYSKAHDEPLRGQLLRRQPMHGQPQRRRRRVLMWMFGLAVLWLFAVSRVYVNASWSDGAWGYVMLPLAGAPEAGDRVLFDPPRSVEYVDSLSQDGARPAGRPDCGGPRSPGLRQWRGPRSGQDPGARRADT